ncbi:MAG: ribonuclease E/G [Alphaproteobacteria bacterium]|nr:ribonuclease E/G [Alphaproteobacteria bacterium]
MAKRMLIDATHPEETRVAVVNGNKLEDYDYESIVRKQLKGNIYLVKVTRVEPSLQAAFVDFGGNRHGFLPFPEVHPDYYRIPIADREALLAEERELAAAEAARQDAEDEAELAARGEKVEEDSEEEGEDEEGDEESADAEDASDEASNSEDGDTEDSETTVAAAAQEQDSLTDTEDEDAESASEEDSAIDEEGVAETEDADEDVDMVGGDQAETPVFRSSIKRRYKIQEVIKRGQVMLIQISKEERGNKGAAVTSYISLPGRYCVLMPNSPRGGGVSRKVSNARDRQRLKQILQELNVPEGMSVILRTAGVSRSKIEIKRDLDYLLRLWDEIRALTLKSTAPALVYEEGDLIKRAIRDLYRREINEVLVAGGEAYKNARSFMSTLMPSHARKVQQYKEEDIPLFSRYQVETQIDTIYNPTVHLKSGGYVVINQTEALVAIDVNSGRATKGRHIEETALKTNLEAADEIARQLRLRDMGGLVVVDFIDMEDRRSNRQVEKRMREAMSIDRARIQLGRISAFGLLEMSRQRMNPSLVETNFETCTLCSGTGLVRTVETTAVMVLRAIEEEAMRAKADTLQVKVPTEIALYIFNNKREMLAAIETRHDVRVFVHADDALLKPAYEIEAVRTADRKDRPRAAPVKTVDMSDFPEVEDNDAEAEGSDNAPAAASGDNDEDTEDRPRRRRGRRGGRRRGRDRERGGRSRGGRRRKADDGDDGESQRNTASDDDSREEKVPVSAAGGADASAAVREPETPPVAVAVAEEPASTGEPRRGWWRRLKE